MHIKGEEERGRREDKTRYRRHQGKGWRKEETLKEREDRVEGKKNREDEVVRQICGVG